MTDDTYAVRTDIVELGLNLNFTKIYWYFICIFTDCTIQFFNIIMCLSNWLSLAPQVQLISFDKPNPN